MHFTAELTLNGSLPDIQLEMRRGPILWISGKEIAQNGKNSIQISKQNSVE